jgi:hypothetical protein
MRAWTTEFVDRERAPVTSNVRASELVGKAELGWDTGPGRDTLFYRAFPGKSRHRPTRLSSPTRTVKTCPLGVMDPRREGKGSPPVVGIRFHIGGERIPGSVGALFPVHPLGRMGHGTGTGRRWPIACRRSRRTHPRRPARWDKWTRRDNKKVDPP